MYSCFKKNGGWGAPLFLVATSLALAGSKNKRIENIDQETE
jgi:hypothetical protein